MNYRKEFLNLLFIVCIFSIAMGFLESAVVIYLRELYFPKGFKFPIAPIEQKIAFVELTREFATMIMLVGVGFMAGRNFISRFAWFLFSFAIWDIFYYVFLKLFLHWPESLLTDDILFLIPVMWIGPVITPVVVALLMLLLASILLKFDNKGKGLRLSLVEWLVLIFGSSVIIIAFAWDFGKYVVQNYNFSKIWVWPTNNVLIDIAPQFIPKAFNWVLYFVGLTSIALGIFLVWYRNREK